MNQHDLEDITDVEDDNSKFDNEDYQNILKLPASFRAWKNEIEEVSEEEFDSVHVELYEDLSSGDFQSEPEENQNSQRAKFPYDQQEMEKPDIEVPTEFAHSFKSSKTLKDFAQKPQADSSLPKLVKKLSEQEKMEIICHYYFKSSSNDQENFIEFNEREDEELKEFFLMRKFVEESILEKMKANCKCVEVAKKKFLFSPGSQLGIFSTGENESRYDEFSTLFLPKDSECLGIEKRGDDEESGRNERLVPVGNDPGEVEILKDKSDTGEKADKIRPMSKKKQRGAESQIQKEEIERKLILDFLIERRIKRCRMRKIKMMRGLDLFDQRIQTVPDENGVKFYDFPYEKRMNEDGIEESLAFFFDSDYEAITNYSVLDQHRHFEFETEEQRLHGRIFPHFRMKTSEN